ncbi:DNA-binding response regulator [Alicyclobacillus contaminans]|uniref:response regulator transcription factor n=1 Tax=Alicyclobacillus contaminans TaxID=392016 RepID=UPI000478AF94|nr:response regulator transcription factor [Alicyclobacillus contaminans]GMA51898.1 DNA-binding response regulator [Alicyclobacillus contaminans]
MNTLWPGAPTALLVDDEEAIVRLLEFSFQKSGFATECLQDGLQAYQRIVENPTSVALVVLDVMLPNLDGFEICRRLRHQGITVPILLLTARDDEIDRVLGLELGADDYVTKPFSPRELVARAKALLRRVPNGPMQQPTWSSDDGNILRAGHVELDVQGHELRVGGRFVELTPTEFSLLRYFMEHPGVVLTRDMLLDQVWGYTVSGDTRVVDVHVSHLRDKIEPSVKKPTYIRTVRGIGYKFVGPPQQVVR